VPRKKDPEKKNVYKGENINIWVPRSVKEAMFKSAKKNFRPLTQEIILAMVEYLERQGMYERPEED
jgi:hypothetical protein